MVEPVDLTQARRVRRQRFRDESTHVVKVLPDTDGELSRALSELEEIRLLIAGEEVDEVGESPSVMQPLADAVGRLASYVAAELSGAHRRPRADGLPSCLRFLAGGVCRDRRNTRNAPEACSRPDAETWPTSTRSSPALTTRRFGKG